MHLPPFAIRFPVHQGCRRADTKGAPLPKVIRRGDCWQLYAAAEKHEGITRQFGKHNGDVGKIGLAVFRALISFTNWNTGQCDPTYAQIAERAGGISIRSVQTGVYALKTAHILEWTPRCVAVSQEGGGFLMRQISHLFSFKFDPPWRRAPSPAPEAGTWGDHPSEGDALDRSAAALDAGVDIDSAMAIAERNADPNALGDRLAASLARQQRFRRRCEQLMGKSFDQLSGADIEVAAGIIRAESAGDS